MVRGDVLQSRATASGSDAYRALLEATRINLIETEFAARLRLGEVGDVIGQLEAAVATYPFQESLWALLITAQYRAGRQTDALSTYQRVRRQLAEELGLDPGPQLQQLEQEILAHGPSIGGASHIVRPAEARLPIGNLPRSPPNSSGRDREIAALVQLTGDTRLVEIVGPGGIGKTAVAIATGATLSPPGGVLAGAAETATTTHDVIDTVTPR